MSTTVIPSARTDSRKRSANQGFDL